MAVPWMHRCKQVANSYARCIQDARRGGVQRAGAKGEEGGRKLSVLRRAACITRRSCRPLRISSSRPECVSTGPAALAGSRRSDACARRARAQAQARSSRSRSRSRSR
eukprot:1158914-Pleurochrysis_carterae.AAC.1